MSPINLAIVGVGKIARDQHLPSIANNPDFELIATASRHGTVDGIPAFTSIEAMLDASRLDDALNGYRVLLKRHPQDKGVRAGIELVEGLKALAARDRLEAAQRFEAALELDPSNERAARELAEMRRQATNERKGLLSRLMGKKEP